MLKSLSFKKVCFEYDNHQIFKGVSFSVDVRERLFILGENGSGKSTLLKIIAGVFSPTSGNIEKSTHMRFFYVPQEFLESDKDFTVKDCILKYVSNSLLGKVNQFGLLLGFDFEKHKEKMCRSLSGGQQKILMLSIAFAVNPDFLLLDEPENHIDIVSRVSLIELLQDFKGGIISISHDRLFIDSLATKIAELAQGVIHISEGDYEDYIEDKMARLGGLQRKFDAETKRIKQLETAVVILGQKAFRGKEVSLYRKKKEELEMLKREHKENGRPEEKKTKIKIGHLSSSLSNQKLLVRIENGSFQFEAGKDFLFKGVNLEARSGNHIVFLGRNGVGKSTFLKCLTKELQFSTGEITWGNGVMFTYFDQHAEFEGHKTAVEVVREKLGLDEEDSKRALGAMKFNPDTMKKHVSDLSGGQRMRLRFAITFGSKADFIILDEPTNHLDEVTWEILLEACKGSKATILLVSHDFEFIEGFNPDVFWFAKNSKIEERHKDLEFLIEELKQ